MTSIVFTGGGTAGHYAPNLALIPCVKDAFDKIYYIGSENGPEKEALKEKRIPYFGVPCVKLERKLTLKNFAIPFKLIKGVAKAKKILKKLSPSVVFSKGGYVALPVVIAAKTLGVPVISHESDMSVGLANKIAARYSSVVFTAFRQTALTLKNGKYMGTPIRREIFEKRDRLAIAKELGFDNNKKVLLIIGGSQGSAAINSAVEKCAYKLVKRYNVLHVCGKGKLVDSKFKDYKTMEYASDMGKIYSVTDLAVSRGGANTLFELISLCIPTLAIPLPKGNSRGDQIENSKYFSDNGLIDVLLEENLTSETLFAAIEKLEKDSLNLTENCRKEDYGKCLYRIADEIKAYANKS